MAHKVNYIISLFITFSVLSQEADSIKPKFENFFGSECPTDTIKILIGKDDYCVLYANEYKLCRLKKDKTKWTIDLNEFRKNEYICMVVRPSPSKPKKRYMAFILAYLLDNETARKLIKLPSGRVVRTIFNDSE